MASAACFQRMPFVRPSPHVAPAVRNIPLGTTPCHQEDDMTQFRFLRPTSWLAKRLGLSVSTIERLRAQGSNDLPPCVRIGGAIRYDDVTVEEVEEVE